MLSAQEIANYLVKNFDTIAASHPDSYQFSILAEIGKGYDGKKINGMVRTVSAEPSPIPSGYVEAKYVFVVEMFVSGSSNYKYLAVNKIVNEFIKANQSSTVDFANGKGIVTFTLGVPKGYKIEYVLGEGVPLTFTVRVTYTENGVTSGDKHWFLDGVEIPFLSESVSVEREGITRKIYTDVYSKILLTGQTKFYNFRIPYESNTFKALQTEILQAPAVNDKVHTLTYYDGAAFTQDKPYTAKVSIFRSASSNSTRPNAAAYDVTFTDVYDSDGKALKYYIALIDFPFDMQGDDTRYFKSTNEQVQYFEAKAAASSAPFIEIEAPNLDGLVITKQVYRTPDAAVLSQFDYVSKNYAVVKVVATTKTQYFYYFIENATIGADGCVMVDLKMDTVQTFFFNPEISFSDCLIERAHLNRFVPVEGDPTKVKFVTDPASKIYNSEEGLNFPKRLVGRQKLKLKFLGSKGYSYDEVDEWLNENVLFWVYIFIDPSKQYKVYGATLKPEETEMGRTSYFGQNYPFRGPTNCICYPIYKSPYFGNINNNSPSNCYRVIRFLSTDMYSGNIIKDFVVAESGRAAFEALNNSSSYYYSIKISCLPPYDVHYLSHKIDNNNNLVIKAVDIGNIASTAIGIRDDEISLCGGIRTSEMYGIFFGSYQWSIKNKIHLITFDYNLLENSLIFKCDIKKQQAPNLAFNPKLNSQNFKELTVTASSGDVFSYDIQKLQEDKVVFEYSEPITPEITKYYLRVKGGTGLYAEGTDENYTGLVGSTDNGLAYANDQYAAYIANNKNFYLQSNIKLGTSALKSTVGIAGQVASGNYAGAVTSGLTAGIDLATSAIDRSLTMDNMKNAPDQLKNANGNVIFNMFCNDLGLYVEKYSALEGDLKTANDFMNLYGFTFSGIANVKDYVHIRKYHNYIKAQLQSINGNISNTVRNDLRMRFANGIRFWNSDLVDYSYENYELWLEN